MKNITIIIVGSLMLAGVASASIVNIDLTHNAATGPTGNDLAGVIGNQTSAKWNAVTSTALHSNLVDEDGNATTVSFDLGEDVPVSWSGDNGSSFFFGYAYLGNQTVQTQNSFAIGGLDDSKTYNLYFYATWGYADTGSEFSLDGGSNWKLSDGVPSEWNAAFSEGDSYVKFGNATSTGGTIDGLWRSYDTNSDNKHRGMFNAVQIEVIPEPGTLSLIAVAGGGILLVRRKFMM